MISFSAGAASSVLSGGLFRQRLAGIGCAGFVGVDLRFGGEGLIGLGAGSRGLLGSEGVQTWWERGDLESEKRFGTSGIRRQKF